MAEEEETLQKVSKAQLKLLPNPGVNTINKHHGMCRTIMSHALIMKWQTPSSVYVMLRKI